tara:strand:+ start:308 stop:895 length:588 start_codon:yes stop_codon:yes gene_type:complete
MTTITLRETKGSPLTFAEADTNFSNLNDNKQEIVPNLNVVNSIDEDTDKFTFYDTSAGAARSILPKDVTPFVERTLIVKCVADGIAPTVGNGITHVTIPSTLNDKNLQTAQAHVYTVGTGGSITNVQLHNLTLGQDMLTTPVTIDLNEKDSSTAATAPVTSAYNGVSTADVIRIDVDAVATNTLGLEIRMVFSPA